MLPVLLAACWSDEPPPPPPSTPPPPPTPRVASTPLPAPLLGVSEVATPPEVLRPTEVVRNEPRRRLVLEVDPDVVPFDSFGDRLKEWGFAVEDGDGRAWRVRAPEGAEWLARVDPLPEVLEARYATTQDMLADGAARGGSEKYGTILRSWTMREGNLVEATEGAALPLAPVMPLALPPLARRCLGPVMEELGAGEARGLGWERGLLPEGPTWVLVAEHLAPCDVTGWMPLRRDGAVAELQIAGRRAAEVDEGAVFEAAVTFLGQERPWGEAATELAVEIVAAAPDEAIREALGRVGDPRAQAQLWDTWSQRDPAMALDFARTSELTAVRARAAAQDKIIRRALLLGTSTPTFARRAAARGWSAGPDDAALLDRLRQDADPVVRAGAWAAWMEKNRIDCDERAKAAAGLGVDDLARLYAECPMDEVRDLALQALREKDPARAGDQVAAVLRAPETPATGLHAVRAAASLQRDDLLEAVVADVHVEREVRRLALEELLRAGRSRKAAALREAHGSWLGLVAPARPVVADG